MQDKAIAAIGRLALQKENQAEPYMLYVQNMFPGVNYDIILAVFSLTDQGGQLSCQFVDVDVEKVSETTYPKYLYRKGASSGGDVTFTTKAGDLSKKLNTLAGNQLKKAIALCRLSNYQQDLNILLALQHRLTAEYDTILNALQSTYGQMDKKRQQASGFSICFELDGVRSRLADFPIFRQQILLSGTSGKSEKYGVTSQGKDQLCSVCLEKKPQLHGFASPFKYATVDKPGMVSGFFDQRGNWKNYPICSDCSLEFEYGQKYINQKLKKYFYGSSYFAIPKTTFSTDTEVLEEALATLESLQYQIKEAEQIRFAEDELMRMIGDSKRGDAFSLNLLFFEENPTTKAIKIKLLLEEILPSRFRRLFSEAPANVNPNPLYKAADGTSKDPTDLRFTFGLFKLFYEDDFYGIMNDVFVGRPINRQTLYTRFMRVIRDSYYTTAFVNKVPQTPRLLILKTHLLLNYLAHLSLIKKNPTMHMQTEELSEETRPDEKYGRVFDETLFRHFLQDNTGAFFQNDTQKGVFALGVLVKLLLNIQRNKLNGASPFENKLKGYNLNAENLRTLYHETLNKLQQYRKPNKKYAYDDLRPIVSEYFTINSHLLSLMTNNELSFYFVAGLEMAYQFRTAKTQTPEELDDQNDN
jgi:CRISPR-associated protein Csh1